MAGKENIPSEKPSAPFAIVKDRLRYRFSSNSHERFEEVVCE